MKFLGQSVTEANDAIINYVRYLFRLNIHKNCNRVAHKHWSFGTHGTCASLVEFLFIFSIIFLRITIQTLPYADEYITTQILAYADKVVNGTSQKIRLACSR